MAFHPSSLQLFYTLTMESEPKHTIAAVVSYDGKPFSGFAKQQGQLTVQGSMEEALELVFKRHVETTCAGRTDSGVHARGQVVSFDLSEEEYFERSLDSLNRSLNALIDERIAVRSIRRMRQGFSARFDAKAREYRYFIYLGSDRPVLIGDRVWQVKKALDVPAMREASKSLIGEHDFKSFCTAASAEGKPTSRNIMHIDIDFDEVFGEVVLVVRVIGNAFLHSMVRTILGTLVAVGSGMREPAWVEEVLQARDRRMAGENAPAQGLVLWRVAYGPDDELALYGSEARNEKQEG